MISERNTVRAFSAFVIGSLLLAMFAFTTQIPALGIALAIDIFLWPPIVLTLAIYLRFARQGQGPRRRPSSSGRELSNGMLLVLAISVLMIVLLGSGLMGNPIVFGAVLLLGVAFSLTVLLGLVQFLPLLEMSLRSAVGHHKQLYRGIRLTMQGRLVEADESFRAYEAQFPGDSRALLWQAVLHSIERRDSEALALVERAIALEPRTESLIVRGQLMMRAGAMEHALADGEFAFEQNPRTPGARDLIAAVFVTQRCLDRAIELLRSAGLSQKTAMSRYMLAEAYRLRGDDDLARKHYDQAVKVAPLFVRYDPLRSEGLWACSLAQLGRWHDADLRVKRTLERNPADPLGLYAKALLEKEMGWHEAIAETLWTLLPIDSGSHVVGALTDPQFTPLLVEKRFRELLAWALGAERQARAHVLARLDPLT